MRFMVSYYRERTPAVGTIIVEGDEVVDVETAKAAFMAKDAEMVHPLGAPTIVKVEEVPA